MSGTIINLIIQLIAGAIGGNVVGAAYQPGPRQPSSYQQYCRPL